MRNFLISYLDDTATEVDVEVDKDEEGKDNTDEILYIMNLKIK